MTWDDLQRFRANQSGQVAVFFGIMALPLLVAIGASLDYTNTVREQTDIKAALDAAVIAAVNNNAIPLPEKPAFAQKHFDANYRGSLDLTLTPGVKDSEVSLLAQGEVPLTFGSIFKMNNPLINDRSAAVISSENTICVLALSETDDGAVTFAGDLQYVSPTCAVHANSKSPSALLVESSDAPIAKSFCAVGGALGDFTPYAKGECKAISDPYEFVENPTPAPCVPVPDLMVEKPENERTSKESPRTAFVQFILSIISRFSGEVLRVYDPEAGRMIDLSDNLTGSYVNMVPGTYCGGLTIDGVDVTFPAGEYIFHNGPLTFINGAIADADEVTFVLMGDKATINIQRGASLDIRAPSDGPRKGIAILESVDKSVPGNRTVENKVSRISDGGKLAVMGTVYLPTQLLEVTGANTSVDSMAPATSFIAHKIHLSGEDDARMTVDIDHQAAGIPPIQPRAEDGARLTE